MSAHHCHALECDRTCPPKMFMCYSHWKRLPRVHQRAIWREYVAGQERNHALVTGRYLVVQARAVLAMGELDELPEMILKPQRAWVQSMIEKYGDTDKAHISIAPNGAA